MGSTLMTAAIIIMALTSAAAVQAQAPASVPPSQFKIWNGNTSGYSNRPAPNDPEALALTAESRRIADERAKFMNQAATFASEGKVDEAIAAYRQAIKINPSPTSGAMYAYVAIGDILASKERCSEAAAEYDKLWGINGRKKVFWGNEEVELKYALRLYQSGRNQEAFATYNAALMRDPFLLKGVDYVPFDIAVTDTNYMTPQLETAAHLALGVFYHGCGDHNQEIEHLQEAIRLKPNYAPSYFFLAEALRFASSETLKTLGGSEGRLAAYRKAASLGDPLVKRRAEQELRILPPLTTQEAAAYDQKEDRRVHEIEQERERQEASPSP